MSSASARILEDCREALVDFRGEDGRTEIPENVFSPEQKGEIIERLTDAMVEIEGENMRPVTWVTIEEVSSGDWGIAGNALTTDDVKALQAGVAA